MNIVNQTYEILTPHFYDPVRLDIHLIELAGRTAYKSEDLAGKNPEKFIRRLIANGHESVLEHSLLTVKFVTDRGITHELVRHRLASYTQESTRYCNYTKNKFGNEITVIRPWWADEDTEKMDPNTRARWMNWYSDCLQAENAYMDAIHMGQTPQEARALLPTCLKSEIVMSTNYREWRHVLKLRTAQDAHPQIRALLIPLAEELAEVCPCVWEDILKEDE